MIANATVTAKTGPADQITSLSLPGITDLQFLPPSQFMRIKSGNNQITDLDMNGVTTFTVSVSGANGTYTITIS